MKLATLLPITLVFAAAAASAQDTKPDITNARFEERAYSGNLESQLRTEQATWFGYAVKSHRHFDNDSCNCCTLEDGCRSESSNAPKQPVELEGTDTIAVLFRVEHSAIEKIRVHSLSCRLDAGGLPFIWINGVPASTSLALFEHLATGSSDSLRDAAIFAISRHESPEAVTLLERLASPPSSGQVRGQAMFWLAQRAGEKAASFITNAIENDPDTEVKKKAVFALSQLPKDEGVPRLIDVARSNHNHEVRKQAFFWLGQSRDPRALAFIEQVLER